MNAHLPPSDDEIERLLSSRLKRTSPEFELRWRATRARLVGRGDSAQSRLRWWLWPGLATAVAAALLAVILIRRPAPVPPTRTPTSVSFEQLLALDAALAPATPLLDPENRDAVLHLPPRSNL
jgi:hypothetical protein